MAQNKSNNSDIASFVGNFLAEQLTGARYREVIEGRYGLKTGKSQTLQAIGNRYGITRERVRQIEALALNSLREKIANSDFYKNFTAQSVKYLTSVGGVQKEDLLFSNLHKLTGGRSAPESFTPAAKLLLELSGKFISYNDNYNKDWHRFWYLAPSHKEKAQTFVTKLVAALKSKKDAVITQGKFDEIFAGTAKAVSIGTAVARNYLTISKKFFTGPFNNFGLTEWPEVNPRTARDWAYAILKKEKRPLHFRDIYEVVSKHRADKNTNLQTVHNELIKDDRFVLVGRGLYGLREFGLMPGTAKEIIAHVLKRNGPLGTRDIIKLVLEQRMIKEATVLINLQNQKHFKSLPDGRYTLREA